MRILIIIGICLFLISCGRWIDDPNDIEKGYQFKRGKIMHQRAVFWWGVDSTTFTADSFNIEDTLANKDYFIVSRKKVQPLLIPPLPPVHAHEAGVRMIDYKVYGIVDRNKEIIVFPVFRGIEPLVNDLCIVTYSELRYNEEAKKVPYQYFGILDGIKGQMLTDLAYDSIEHNINTREIHVFSGDSLYDMVKY